MNLGGRGRGKIQLRTISTQGDFFRGCKECGSAAEQTWGSFLYKYVTTLGGSLQHPEQSMTDKGAAEQHKDIGRPDPRRRTTREGLKHLSPCVSCIAARVFTCGPSGKPKCLIPGLGKFPGEQLTTRSVFLPEKSHVAQWLQPKKLRRVQHS